MSPVLAQEGKRAAGEAGRETIRKVNREVVVLLGWGPAILMQFAHPLVAGGVAQPARDHWAAAAQHSGGFWLPLGPV